MAGSDDGRVEVRLSLVGRGSATTPERIAELEKQAKELDQARKPKPTKSFGALVAAKGANAAAAPPSSKDAKRAALPKKAPRPGLAHPAQRDMYGREDDDDGPIILKG